MNISTTNLPAQLQETVQRHLRENEQVLWCAQPEPKHLAKRPLAYFIILPSATIAGIVILYLRGHDAYLTVLVSLIVGILAGLCLLLAAWWQQGNAKETLYLITNERALIIEPSKTYSLPAVGILRILRQSDGITDFILTREEVGGSNRGAMRDVGFFGIRDGERVQQLLVEQFQPYKVCDDQ